MIPSKASCSSYIFVVLSFQKSCDKFKVILSVRFQAENVRYAYERVVMANNVENLLLNFNKGLTLRNKIYKNFRYTADKEIILMSYGITPDFVNTMTQTLPCRTFPCTFSENDKCNICTPPTLVYDGKCVTQCPDNFYKSRGKCLPCAVECKTCTGPLNGTCNECKDGFFKDGGFCLPKCKDRKALSADCFLQGNDLAVNTRM